MKLTSSQIQAIEYDDGPLLIIAGAGTGKTTVLVEKVKYIIKQGLAKPDEILALTFTDKAAAEMEERVDKALPYGQFQMNISTFHSFCDTLLRNEASHIGLSAAYKLSSTAAQVYFMRKNLFLFDLDYFRPLGNPNKFIEGILQHFSRLRDEDITPDEYLKFSKKTSGDKTEDAKNRELAQAYKKFQSLKAKENILDFADLIYYTLKLFRDRPNITSSYQKKYKFILVDEFQDTNIAQYELIKLLAPQSKKTTKLTVIGDDNQSIYKFRGASVSNILQFMRDYKKAKSVILLENFRSYQEILDGAYTLIKHNDPDTLEAQLKISKNLKSMRGKSKKDISFAHLEMVEEEAEYVGNQIKLLTKKYAWQDIAILVRANAHVDAFARVLGRMGIPYQFLGPGMLFKQPEIKDLIAYLNVLYDVNDSASFYRVLSMDFFNIDQKDLNQLLSFTRKTSLSLYSATEAYLSFYYKELNREEYAIYKQYLFLTKPKTREVLLKITKLITKAFSHIKKDSAGQILYSFLEESGYLAKLMDHTTEKEERIAINISKLFDKLKTFEMQEEDASVSAVVDYITMSMELGESPLSADIDWGEYDAVNILTVHTSKGLEFPVVFMVNLTVDRFPTRQRSEQIPIPQSLIKELLPEGNFHIEEERRLFYVGLTRARDRAFLTAARYYVEGKRERKISPFVLESIGEESLMSVIQKKKEEKAQLSIFDDKSYSVFKKQEEHPLKKIFSLTNFSYSQINTYTICPLRYKYQYVLKIPTTPDAAGSFGQSIHIALQQLYEILISGEKPNLETLLDRYNQAWIPIGYKSKTHEDRMKIEGKKFLEKFYKNYFDKNAHVADLEKWFKIKIDNDIYLSGKMDRVDKTTDGVEIIDYKTGKMPTDKEIAKNFQLSLYALAASDKSSYGKPVQNIVLTFYFLKENKKVSLTRTEKDLTQVKDKIKATVEKIRSGNFNPHVGPWCDFCPFKINCEAWQ